MMAYYKLTMYVPAKDYDRLMADAKHGGWNVHMEFPYARDSDGFRPVTAAVGGFTKEDVNGPPKTPPSERGES